MKLEFTSQGRGRAVVLLHGFPLDRSLWLHQREALSARCRLILPDLRGHGASPAPPGAYTMDELADDVIELMDDLGVTEPVIGGMSMGGYVVLSLALRFPREFRALLLINTRAGADTPETARVREDLAQLVEGQGSPQSVVDAMLPKLFAPGTYAEQPALVEQYREQMLRTSPLGVAGALRGMAIRPDRTPDLARIALPTLVVAGQGDQLIPISESQKLARGIAGAELAEIADAGHMAPCENPSAFNQVILDFLDKLP